jgi:hypothetical protein
MQIDATEEDNKALATKFGVQGFPTLKVSYFLLHLVPRQLMCSTASAEESCSESCPTACPSLQIFRNGDAKEPTEYKGPREAAGIVSYLTKKSQPASSLLSSAAEVTLTCTA